jgi:hypothetical protein
MAVATQNALNIPGPPKFATVEEERRHRKQRISVDFRVLYVFVFLV